MEPKHEAKTRRNENVCGRLQKGWEKDEISSDSIALLLQMDSVDTQSPTGVHDSEAFTDQFTEWMFQLILECP